MKCRYCQGKGVKKGVVKNRHRYQCKNCKKYQQNVYRINPIPEEKYLWVRDLTCEGCSISSISRLLHITKSSVQRIIMKLASEITVPELTERDQKYEIDELRTYCGNKNNELWVIYAINKLTGKVIDFCVGRRTKENINKVV